MDSSFLTPMNHREIEYNARKLPGCNIPGSFACDSALMQWLDETGKRVFDNDLVMDYGTDCLRLYLLFENTPKENDAPYYDSWQEGALEGIYKFLGRYRRMILVSDEWNRRGNYSGEKFSEESIARLNHALEDANVKIRKYISRGNTMSNRHNIVSALMELLNVYQKELKIGQIVTSLHVHAIKVAVPYNGIQQDNNIEKEKCDRKCDTRNPCVTKLCQEFIVLTAPYAQDLSKILWNAII